MSSVPQSTLSRSQRDVVIVEGCRTPFVKAAGAFASVHPAHLGQVAVKELLHRSNLDVNTIDEVIIGNTGNPADAVNIARVVALNAGVPQKTSAYTVHRNCASALESLSQGYEKIRSGTMDVIIAGGTENMSQIPWLMPKHIQNLLNQLVGARSTGERLRLVKELLKANIKQVVDLVTTAPMAQTKFKPINGVMQGLTDPFVGINMGQTAEILAKEFQIGREQQDAFALKSHQKAVAAQKKMLEETVPLMVPPNFENVVSSDQGPRDNQTMEALAKLKPFFDRQTGTITAGNSCPITDGAAAMLLMSREKAQALGYKPLARIVSYGFAGLEPERMGLGPAYATPVALKRAGLELNQIKLFELNEAFAAQVIACQKAMASDQFCQQKLGLKQKVGEIPDDLMNVNGGAIALGHPVGATGTRLVLTLMKEMRRRQVQFGLATLCIGGGQGGAMILESEA